MFIMFDKIYVGQPYWAGGQRRSLAIILPAKLTKACNINTSTAFEFRISEDKKSIILQILNVTDKIQRNLTMSAGERFQAFSQQTQTKP